MIVPATNTAPARFDDLTPGAEHAFVLDEPIGYVVANELDEVEPALRAVEEATRSGSWAAGFVAYEAAPAFDTALTVHDRAEGRFPRLPLVWFGLYSRRRQVAPLTSVQPGGEYTMASWEPSLTEGEYRARVNRIRSHIAAGDTYQVNFTFRLHSQIEGDLDGLYRDLVLAQRGGYAAHLDIGGFTIVSASPEQFFRVSGGRITTRPMKGTAPRGRWAEEDSERAASLLASEKDRAENLMIVDLLRNDIGRVARFGSVKVPELFTPERYETVWQLTSTIEAELEPGVGLVGQMKALFPSGSITGAPKPRTMEFIADLETTPRGVYCGAIGYVSPPEFDDQHFNVAIRTVVVDNDTRSAEYGTGGGITWDSSARGEYAEALLKAELLTARTPSFDLLETLRWENGEYRFLEKHLDRMSSSADYFGFEWDHGVVADALHGAAIGLNDATRVRLTVDRAGHPTVHVTDRIDTPFVDGPNATDPGRPIRLGIAHQRVNSSNAMLFHKTTHRAVYETAAYSIPTADDVLLVSENGHVTESTIANIAVRFGSEWRTPPLSSGCLPGVYRQVLVAEGKLREQAITLDDLSMGDEISLINSVRGWRVAHLLDG